MEPRRPTPSNPSTTPLAQPVAEETGETASGPHTAPGDPSSRAPAPLRDPQRGDVIGPYRILGELGRGGMAVVYLAEEPELSRQVALKLLLPAAAAADPQAKARFAREARAQAKFEHPHVVTIYRVGEAGGVSYIAMPVLKGQTLSAALRENPRPPLAEVVRIAGEIAEGLAAAHAAGLVHRDIKPGNIWLEVPKRWVKLLDFGLARAPEVVDAQITVTGKVVGTPAYMSPEQAAGKPVDHRTDLFSLGVVLYQMATGQKPFTGETSINIMAAILTAEPTPPGALVPDLPPALNSLILRLLAKHPSGRPQTASQVVAELEVIRRSLAAPPVVVVSLPAVPGPPPPAPAALPADPWSNLGSPAAEETEEDEDVPVARPGSRHPRPGRGEDEPRRRDPRREAPPRSLKWAWVSGGALAGLLLLGGLVWLAVSAVSKKPEAVEKKERDQPRPAPQPPKAKDKDQEPSKYENDRASAEQLIPKAKLKLLLDGGPQELEVPAGGALPAGKITILEIDYADAEGLDRLYVSNTFLPAVAALKSVTEIRLLRWQMEMSAAHVALLAGKPLANSLQRFDAALELTPESLAELKKFKALDDATFLTPEPTDALFARLAADLPRLRILTFLDTPASPDLTSKGWQAVGRLPRLRVLSLVRCEPAAGALRALTALGATASPGSLGIEFQGGKGLTDAALRDLGQRDTDLAALTIHRGDFTDEGLAALAAVKSLKKFTVRRNTKVTEKGVRALVEARPDMRVTWDDKVFEPKVP